MLDPDLIVKCPFSTSNEKVLIFIKITFYEWTKKFFKGYSIIKMSREHVFMWTLCSNINKFSTPKIPVFIDFLQPANRSICGLKVSISVTLWSQSLTLVCNVVGINSGVISETLNMVSTMYLSDWHQTRLTDSFNKIGKIAYS